MHLAFSVGLCMLLCGNEELDSERKAIRHAMIVENLQQLYTVRAPRYGGRQRPPVTVGARKTVRLSGNPDRCERPGMDPFQ
jgi:hypothetical protein